MVPERSSGLPHLPIGILAVRNSNLALSCLTRLLMSVSIKPGAIPFTLIPSDKSSFHDPRTRPPNADLAAV